jgi:hypothetical protein
MTQRPYPNRAAGRGSEACTCERAYLDGSAMGAAAGATADARRTRIAARRQAFRLRRRLKRALSPDWADMVVQA